MGPSAEDISKQSGPHNQDLLGSIEKKEQMEVDSSPNPEKTLAANGHTDDAAASEPSHDDSHSKEQDVKAEGAEEKSKGDEAVNDNQNEEKVEKVVKEEKEKTPEEERQNEEKVKKVVKEEKAEGDEKEQDLNAEEGKEEGDKGKAQEEEKEKGQEGGQKDPMEISNEDIHHDVNGDENIEVGKEPSVDIQRKDSDVDSDSHFPAAEKKSALGIVRSLMKHKEGFWFNSPVDPVAHGVPDYFDVVKKPMDFSTVESKLDKNAYHSLQDFIDDVKLIFSNCRLYNQAGTVVYNAAVSVEKVFDEKLSKLNKTPKPSLESPQTEKRPYKRQKPAEVNVDESRPKRIKHTPPPKDVLPFETQPPKSVAKKVKLTFVMKFCAGVLKELMSKKYQMDNWPFLHPVDVAGLGLKDYYDIVKHPMDLGTVKQRLDSGYYSRPEQFAADVRLVFSNCLRYNPPELEISKMAIKLQSLFESKFALLPDAPDDDEGESDADDSSSSESESEAPSLKEKSPEKKSKQPKKPKMEDKEEKERREREEREEKKREKEKEKERKEREKEEKKREKEREKEEKKREKEREKSKEKDEKEKTPKEKAPKKRSKKQSDSEDEAPPQKLSKKEDKGNATIEMLQKELQLVSKQLLTVVEEMKKGKHDEKDEKGKEKEKEKEKDKEKEKEKEKKAAANEKRRNSKSQAGGQSPGATAKKAETKPASRRNSEVKPPPKRSNPKKVKAEKSQDDAKLNKEMTFEEKHSLSQDIGKLPSDKLGKIVEIIQKRHSELKNSAGEIEIEIDSLDTRTLREMEKYVHGQLKKSAVSAGIEEIQGKLKKLQEPAKASKDESSSSSDDSSDSDSGSSSDDN